MKIKNTITALYLLFITLPVMMIIKYGLRTKLFFGKNNKRKKILEGELESPKSFDQF